MRFFDYSETFLFAFILGAISLSPVTSKAALFYWDIDPTTAGNQNGSGSWVSGETPANASWTSVSGGANAAWVNGSNTAVFGSTSGYTNNGTGGTVTLGENITLNRIDKSSQAGIYTIEPSVSNYTITLTGGNAGFGNNNALSTDALIINASVNGGTGGVLKFNSGAVILAGANTWSGGTRIETSGTIGSSSVLQIGNGGTSGTLGTGDVTFVSNGANDVQSVLAFKRSDSITLSENLVSATVGLNKGILRQAGAGTLIVASENAGFSGATQVTAGTLQVGDGTTNGTLGSTSSVAISTGATLSFNRSDTVSFSSAITGAGKVLKTGAGTLTMAQTAGANTYTGETTISEGVLQVGNTNALPINTTVAFTGNATFDLNGFSQTIANLTVADNVKATVTGAAPGSVLNMGTTNWVIGSGTANNAIELDMSGLDSLVFNSATNIVRFGSQNNSASNTVVVTLAKSNTITAASFGLADLQSGLTSGFNNAKVYLGKTNVINASTIFIGSYKSDTLLDFADGVTDGTLKLRATNGTGRATMTVGKGQSGGLGTMAKVDVSDGTLDALLATLIVGQNDNSGVQGTNTTGTFTMGAGTLDAMTIILGDLSNNSTITTYQGNGTFDLQSGGTVKTSTLTLSNKSGPGTGAGIANGTFNLLDGTLRAATIQRGTGTGTANVNWTKGTITTYDATTNLSINGVALRLDGTNERIVDIGTGRTATVNAAISNVSGTPTVAFTKRGAGVLLLGGANTYAGSTDIEEGTVRTSASNVLSDASTLNFTGNTTLDIQGNSDAVANITIAENRTATITGTGTLTLNGNQDLVLGGLTANKTITLDMSQLGGFVYNNATKSVRFGSQKNAANNNLIVNLAQSNTITAASFALAELTDGAVDGPNRATVHLGRTNVINANSVLIGNLKSTTRLDYAAGTTDGTLMIRGTAGGTSRAALSVGIGQSGSVNTDAEMDVSGGTLDAWVSTLEVARNDNSGTQGSNTSGSFIMGAGTLDATSITVGSLSNNSSDVNYVANGTFTLNGSGTVKTSTLTLSQRTSSGNGTANGTFNLTQGTVKAATIQRGTAPKGTSTFNWNSGNIENYDATTDLNVTGVDLTINGTGTRGFNVSSGRTATVSSTILNGASTSGAAFVKDGTGRLVLLAANTYSGSTTVNQGALVARNTAGSATGSGSVVVQTGGILAGTGFINPTGSSSVNVQGMLKAGDLDETSANVLSFDLSGTTGTFASTGTLSFDLFTNVGNNSAILASSDRLRLIGADAGDLTFSGILQLGLNSGSTLDPAAIAAGDKWLIVDWTGLSGGLPTYNFSSIDSSDIVMSSGLKWILQSDSSGLYAVAAAIPEPGRAFLLLLGTFGLLLRRRR